jgi:hypothetical protein
MIVLAPTDSSEKYFTSLAKDAWTNYILRDTEVEDAVIKVGKTLIISCEIDEDGKKVPVKFHYRFLRGTLYCFVEEI